MKFKIISITEVTCSIELINDLPYEIEKNYKVYLNDELIIEDNKNVFTIFSLEPNTTYEIKIVLDNIEEKMLVTTLKIAKIINVKECGAIGDGISDDTSAIQRAIDSCEKDQMIVIPQGIYYIKPLFLKSNITINLKKNAVLLGWIDRRDYPILPGIVKEDEEEILMASWEGENVESYASLITAIGQENIRIIGEGTIDGNADKSDWWVNHHQKRGAWRPNLIFLNRCQNVLIEGVVITNSPSWTIHPYYCSSIDFINIKVINPKDSPNTDGCNPESSDHIRIIGAFFSVGDDCIAIKSGKMAMTYKHYKPTEEITIRNCLMRDGHGAVVLGSEMSSGIKRVEVTKCLFIETDRGLRIKTRRGRGNKAIVDEVKFSNIIMERVLNPFVINMYYFCDPDGKTDYVATKKALPVDERTPYLGRFNFENIRCYNTIVSAGYFYGLPEMPIEEIILENIEIDFMDSQYLGKPAMMADCPLVNRMGFFFKHVKKIVMKDVIITGQIGEAYMFNDVSNVIN